MSHSIQWGRSCTRGENTTKNIARPARAPRKRSRARCVAEGLERRRLFAAVSWDGGGDGTNWTSPGNWSGNVLPAPADDVTISVAANPTILVPSGTHTIRSLVSNEAIRTTGGTLSVTTTATASQPVTLAGGGLSGGAWHFNTGGAGAVIGTSSGGTLHNVAITGGDLLLNTGSATMLVSGTTSFPAASLQASNANISLAPGYVLNSLITAEGASIGQRSVTLAQGGVGTVTIAPSGIVRLAAGCGGNMSIQNSSLATLVNNGLITNEAAGRSLFVQNNAFTNNATTQALAGTLSVGATNWSNAATGTMSAASGTTLNLSGNWSNAGTLGISAATLDLGGTFATTGFNFTNFARTGGTVNLSGALNNSGSTLTLDASTGTWNLSGGTITGGTVNQTGGAAMALTSNGGTLSNVAVSGADLVLNSGSASVLLAGTTTFSAVRLQASNVNVSLAPGYVLGAPIIGDGAAAGQRSVSLASGGVGTVTIAPGGSMRLAAGCGGNLSIQNSSNATLVNNGTILNEAAGRSLLVQNNVFTNNATTQVTAGTLSIGATNWSNTAGIGTISAAAGTTLALTGTWSNAGSLVVNNAALTLGGTFATSGFNFAGFGRTAGTVTLTGTLNNATSTLTLDAATGTWNLSGGTITGGTVDQTAGSLLAITSGGGTLNNVTLGGDLLLDASSASVLVTGTTSFPAARLRGSNTSLNLAPGYVVSSLIVAEGATTGQRSVALASGGTGTVTIAPAGVVRLAAGCGGLLSVQNSSLATLVNNGLITNEAAGRSLLVQNDVFTNNATTQALAGTLSIGANNWSNAAGVGVISAAAGTTLTFAGAWSNAGAIAINNATLNLGGSFSTSGFNFPGFARSGGGTVNLTGTLNNTGSTLTLNAATGTWNFSGGTINGGTVDQTGGSLLAMTSGGGTLSSVAVNGDLLFDVTSAHVLVNGSTSFPAARLRANGADLRCAPSYTINSLVVAEGAATGQRAVSLAFGGAGAVTVAPTGEIRLAPGCGGNLSVQNSSIATLHNNGAIFNQAPGRTMYIQNSALTHSGTLFALAGTIAVTPGFTNTGGVGVGPGAVMTIGGSLINGTGAQLSTAGRLQIAGLLDIKPGSSAIAQPGGNARIRVKALAIAPNNLLQLNDNDLIVDYDPPGPSPIGGWDGSAYTGILGMVTSAYNFGGWDGPGISTEMPQARAGLTGIAVDEAANAFGISGNQVANWEGDNVDATCIVIKYTYVGDVNFDGTIDASDYGVLDYFVQIPGASGYANGDFNLDGFIDASDYGVIDYVIQNQGSPL